ncbi:MAG: methyltransferase domain-containing protein [Desulfobacteraceae bacterium]|jgi:ubiquinone/menaquinone biosynthesis C-methylase UbiE|nr:methyltransferase domain-containing protein [Desulfobacteraceae bacterium]
MKIKNNQTLITAHYRQTDLESNIRSAFEKAGQQIKDYTDTESLDEFHIRGRAATRELARLGDLQKGMHVLDIGCGVGGPARMLAAEFGCVVTGVELVEEYCEAGNMITQQTGLSHMVKIKQGDMTELVFDDQMFDAVWTLHTIMNIEDKVKLFDSIFCVLKPGGVFALYEICAGVNSPPYFPVPWAGDASMSFLFKPDALRLSLNQSGFKELQWRDVSHKAIKWFQSIAKKRAASMKQSEYIESRKKRSRPGISLLLGSTAAEKSKNVFRNLTEDRIRTIFGVFQKPYE